jgi:hypothetical protein
VLAGARHHGFPEPYIAAIEGIESVDDPDADRRAANEALIDACGRPLAAEGPSARERAAAPSDHG